jgi:hypothetical protein
MRNLSSIFSFKNRDPFAAIVLFAVLVISIETMLAFVGKTNWKVSFKGDVALPAKSPDLQVMGDSVAKGAVICQQLTEALPGHPYVLNTAIGGSGPEFSYFVLKREIAAGKAPKAILCAPSPHTFASGRIALLAGAFCTWPEIAELAKQRIAPCEIIYGIFTKLSWTLRYREQLADRMRGRAPETEGPQPVTDRMAGVVHRHYPAENLRSSHKQPFGVFRLNEIFLDKFMVLAEENHIPVYWATPPVLSVVYENRKQYNFDQAYFRFLDDVSAKYHVQTLQREFLIYPEDEFIDYDHLDKAGAARFTQLLAEKISRSRADGKSAKRLGDGTVVN